MEIDKYEPPTLTSEGRLSDLAGGQAHISPVHDHTFPSPTHPFPAAFAFSG